MTPIRLIAVSAFIAAVSACTNSSHDDGGAYRAPQSAPPLAQANPDAGANPTYDTPAAYEESAAPKPSSDAVIDPGLDSPRSTAGSKPSAGRTLPAAKVPGAKPSATAAAAPSSAGGTTHTVVKGDTLGGIARKYGVTSAAIMKANNMTKDVVVLGKTLVIPAH